MKNQIFILFLASVAIVSSKPIKPIVHDEDCERHKNSQQVEPFLGGRLIIPIVQNEDFERNTNNQEVVPGSEGLLIRTKRQTGFDLSNTGFGLSHTGTIWNNDNNKLGGTAFGNKQFGGPLTLGGGLNYEHLRSGSGVALTGSHTNGMGSDLGVKANYNIFQSNDKNTQLGLSGTYDRHFGGPGGTTHPNYGALLNFSHKFGK